MLEEVLKKWGASEVSAIEVYSDMFSLGEGLIQKANDEKHDLKSNPVAYWKNNDEKKGHYRIMFDDTFSDTLEELQRADFSIMNGVSYFGRKNLQASANRMFALIFDLDGVTDTTLNNFLSGAVKAEVYPVPNYMILSGHGVHLYYVFENPVPLYPYLKIQLKNLKYALTEKMWNGYTSKEKKVQYQGINQGFRVIGGKTKIDGVRVRAFRLNVHPFSVSQLCEYVPEEYRVDESKLYKESKLTLAEAREKYPEWYEKRVIQKSKAKGHWTCKRDLYEWWLRQIREGASLHHRYFNVMCLAVYAVKSGISEAELKHDAYGLVGFLDGIAPSEPFKRSDVKSALECYDERYCTFPIDDISKLSGIQIQKNKRNGRTRSEHINRLNKLRVFARDELGEDAYKNNGRPKRRETVRRWRADHPEGIKADCIRDTGLDRKTVSKWWDQV